MVASPFLILVAGGPPAGLRGHGGFGQWIRVAAGLDRGAVRIVDVAAGEELPARDGFAGAIVSGSPAMVTDRHEWSERTASWLAEAVPAGLPVLGICYGHQLLAHALGGTVKDNPAGRRMGTMDVELLPEAGEDALLAPLPDRFAAQVTHVQHVSAPPPGAVVLARADHDPCHAFRVGDSAWGFQFHPEFGPAQMRGYIRSREQLLTDAGFDPQALAQQVSVTPHAGRVLRRFVHHSRKRGR